MGEVLRGMLEVWGGFSFISFSCIFSGVARRMWTGAGIMTVWALLLVPARQWRDLSGAVGVKVLSLLALLV